MSETRATKELRERLRGVDEYRKAWLQQPIARETEPHPCFCTGPKPGHAKCPCMERQNMNARIDDAIRSGRSPWDKTNP